MSTSSHTAGPWYSTAPNNVYIRDGRDRSVASVLSASGDLSEDERNANARLIAAAPELLKLVDDLYQLFADAIGEEEPTEKEIEVQERLNAVLDRIHGR